VTRVARRDIKKMYSMVYEINKSIQRAQAAADRRKLMSVSKSLDACKAIIDNLLESLSGPLEVS
jgi:flagellin-specific chaperone FliS